MKNKRLAFIDTLRFIAIWPVMKIHADLYFGWPVNDFAGWFKTFAWFLDKTCSFAVPLFFMMAGYFFGESYSENKNITKVYLKYVRRLLIIFIGWSILYLIAWFKPLSTNQWHNIEQLGLIHAFDIYLKNGFLKDPGLLLFAGTSGHLWFISALIQTITLMFFFIIFKKENLLIYLAILTFILKPFAHLYIPPPHGYTQAFNPVLGVLFSTPAVIMGWLLSKEKEYNFSTASQLLFIGILLIFGEFTNFLNLNFFEISTLLIPFSLFMFALLHPEWSRNTVFPELGQMTVGIYCVHPLIIFHLAVFKGIKNQYLWDIPLLLTTYLISLFIVLILKSHPLTRKLAI